MSLARKVSSLLKIQGKTLSIAESCSGGLLSHRLTNIPGSSLLFKLGVIAYSNEAKISLLKIPARLIRQHGAVSAPVAERMAANVRCISRTDFSIALTGIAGPGGGTKRKPVGLTYIALNSLRESQCKKFIFKGPRAKIKHQAAEQALGLLLKSLTSRPR